MARYIFITGGVVSSLGKGLMAASLAALLQARGYRVRIRKFDPYLNVDPGTMSPHQHGEVYVTDDGADLGRPTRQPEEGRRSAAGSAIAVIRANALAPCRMVASILPQQPPSRGCYHFEIPVTHSLTGSR